MARSREHGYVLAADNLKRIAKQDVMLNAPVVIATAGIDNEDRSETG